MKVVPALEIGGTHVAAAMVNVVSRGVVVGTRSRMPLEADGTAGSIVATIVACAETLDPPAASTWGVAIPGPFDYAAGIGGFEGVAKFGALRGVDVGQHLLAGLPSGSRLVFLNDADAFLIGEWAAGAGIGHDRVAGITLGTGVGSAFLAEGRIIEAGPDVPPRGEVHLLSIDGHPLEDTVSRRAIIAAYRHSVGDGTGAQPADVAEIANRARHGQAAAQVAIERPLQALGEALAPWLARFGATALVVGGSMAGSWDLVEPPLRAGLAIPIQVVCARLPDDAGLIGAALHAAGSKAGSMTRHAASHEG